MESAANLASTDRQLLPAVLATIAALDLDDLDQAGAKLAEIYARAIDDARQAERWADAVLRKVGDDTELYDEIRALRTKLSARVALSDYGPKLAAVLVELGATPKARAAMAKGKPAQPAADPTSAGLLRMVQGVPPGA